MKGATHAQGGIPLGNNQEGENGEAIINAVSTRKFLPELSAINVAGGGVPLTNRMASPSMSALTKFQNGGIIQPANSPAIDLAGLEESIASAVQVGAGTIKVQNVASETTDEAIRVENIQAGARF